MAKVYHLRVRGIVQGVGFRPFVWRLAREMGATGTVLNDNDGVLIALAGVDREKFCLRLLSEAPAAARISRIDWREAEGDYTGFDIVESKLSAGATPMSPDLATCPDCLAETMASMGRRSGYSFTNCTNCGPRFSIIEKLPYDRPNTAMQSFAMCENCAAEYGNPADRRFHAQPIACPDCGPKIWLEGVDDSIGQGDVIGEAVLRIQQGQVIAIKGLGGFHLACDASNERAVLRLRLAKHRNRKPLALMARDKAQVARHALVSDEEFNLLTSSAAPIVLLKPSGTPLAPSLAPGHDRLGFMFPYTPLHHLLMARLEAPIVLTSANVSDEPQVAENEEARATLIGMADALLMHDRPIAQQIDDSLVRHSNVGLIHLRRARGYAPAPLGLHQSFREAPQIVGMGADLKSTLALLHQGQATVSHHLGDLSTPRARAAYEKALQIFLSLHNAKLGAVSFDLHPEFFGTRQGHDLAMQLGIPTVDVQHHHAHIASVMAENGWPLDGGAVLGLALDGVGLGDDGTLWGGEILKCDFAGFERLDHVAPLRLPGADISARQPWRCLAAVYHLAEMDVRHISDVAALRPETRAKLDALPHIMSSVRMATKSSSMGRIFDAFAALCGLCVEAQDYEGEAPMLLEAAAQTSNSFDRFEMEGLNFATIFRTAARERQAGIAIGILARKFHNTVVHAFALRASQLCRSHDCDTVALSGGIFNNSLILEGLVGELTKNRLQVLKHNFLPSGDGGISLGQVAIAGSRLTRIA